ncbi:MAG: methyl-accepting chemotaxis protein [Desulfobacteraceae bacterium]|nr:methyl-accepting chemotaxis protein [Desulfobacteraceae bacterium]
MKLSLKNRFLVPTLVLTAVGMGALALTCGMLAKSALTDGVNTQLQESLTLSEQKISLFFEERTREIKTWSEDKEIRKAIRENGKTRSDEANAVLLGMQKLSGHFQSVLVADADGDVKAVSDTKAPPKLNIKERDYFKEAMQGRALISDVVHSKVDNTNAYVIAVPVRDGDKIVGVLAGMLGLESFSEKFVDPVKVGEHGASFMIQRDGMFIAHTFKNLVLKENAKNLPFTKRMIEMGNGMLNYEYKGEKKIGVFRTNKESGWILGLSASEDDLNAPVMRIYFITGSCVAGMVVLMALLIVMIANSTTGPIKRIASSLGEGAEQVSSASVEIASASQQLAEGASEQAASIEETSSSLEEMSSMTRQNSDNAREANNLMTGTRDTVSRAGRSMEELTVSMAEITRASEETSKIIKTIDEIAFQTNLLALNAAVEAARAGEAGAGFAVVADEVRNLAMRAAEAAKNTASLIEGTVKKIREGSELVQRTEKDFREVASGVAKSVELVGEIAASSQEQAQGIEQVNKAVSNMDVVVQRNAENSEETAAASEQMSSQAKQMHDNIRDLTALVAGTANGKAPSPRKRSGGASPASGSAGQKALAAKTAAAPGNGKPDKSAGLALRLKADARKQIPLDEDF